MDKKLMTSEIFKSLPERKQLIGADELKLLKDDHVIVVLDDDPTGTQTVHNVPVITDWSEEWLTKGLLDPAGIFYLLTNSRSLQPDTAATLTREIVHKLKLVSAKYNKSFLIISRSDSTLRGHFPLETDTIKVSMGMDHCITVINPAFFEGGRYTINNIHYVEENEYLLPASETPFAQDTSFGYSHSNLYDWIIEKTKGEATKDDIFDLSIDELRTNSIHELTEKILANSDKKYMIVNAVDYEDEKAAVCAIMSAFRKGVPMVFRTAASIVPAIAGIDRNPILEKHDFESSNLGGLVMIGSYVPKSTLQLNYLLKNTDVYFEEISVETLLDQDRRTDEVNRIAKSINSKIIAGLDVVCCTSRELKSDPDKSKSLDIINQVSTGIVEIIEQLKYKPKFFIAKGGITSSDIATKGLMIKRANVKGQILPGVPVWECGQESRFPDLVYVVFPGNVGTEASLYNAYQKLK